MNKVSGWLFCTVSLGIVIGAMWFLYPYAARSAADVETASTPMGAEMFDDVDMGDFGMIPVLDMMQHYIDNPPIDTGEPEQRFAFKAADNK